MRQYKFDQICAGLNNGQEEGTGRTATSASEYPMVVGALAEEKTRDAARTKIPMQ